MLAGAGHGGVEGNPVAAELKLAIRNHRLPVERLSRLIDEHQFDLYNDPMPTMAALEGYIDDTCCALPVRCAIAGRQSGDVEHLARHAGLAQGSPVIAALPLMPRGGSCSCRCNCWRAMAAEWKRCLPASNPEPARGAGSADRRGAGHSEDRLRATGECATGGAAGILPLALVRRDLQRMARADNDPFVPQVS
jgi:phytoene synthase